MRRIIRAAQAWLPTSALVAALVLAWAAVVRFSGVSDLILPSPNAVGHALIALLGDPQTYQHALVTVEEVLLGFAMACVVGVVLGAAIAKTPWLERLLQPLIVASQVAPKTPFIPLLIVWFGFGITAKVIVAAILAFFPIFTNTVLGVKSTPEGLHDVISVLRLPPRVRFWRLELPHAMPSILAGMEVGIVLAMIGAIVGEFLAGSRGLGYLTVASMNNFQTAQLFAVIILLTVLGFLMHLGVLLARRRIVYWHESSQAIGGDAARGAA
jgi:NitT/TauT family transport system permease protein